MRSAIYGAGSLGTVLGAYLSRNGVEIDLINRNRDHVEALNRNGARITGTVDMTVPVKALLPEDMTGTYDIIFLMTKQLNNRETVTFLKNYLAEDGLVVTMQNGIPENGIAEIIGSNRTVGCVVEWGATLTAPGECRLTSEPDSLSFHMGGMPGIPDNRLQRVKDLLEVCKTCRECPYNLKCGGGCRAEAVAAGEKNLTGPDPYRCLMWKDGYLEKLHEVCDGAIEKYCGDKL